MTVIETAIYTTLFWWSVAYVAWVVYNIKAKKDEKNI